MTIVWSDRARRDMRRLGSEVARRVVVAVERYAATGQGDIKCLTDASGEGEKLTDLALRTPRCEREKQPT